MRERTHNLNHTAGGHNNAAEKKTLRHRGRDLQPARAVSWLAVAERLKGQKRLTDLCDELINKCHFFPSTWQTGYLEFLKTETILKKKSQARMVFSSHGNKRLENIYHQCYELRGLAWEREKMPGHLGGSGELLCTFTQREKWVFLCAVNHFKK